MELGNFDDHRFCRDGVRELRVDVGPGYRVYYAIAGS
jgi:putative addiction module killer protein